MPHRIPITTFLILATATPSLFAENIPDPYRSYSAGDYETAANAYEQQLETSRLLPNDALHYGAAASAYKMGDFQKSIQSFGQALLSRKPAVQEKAHYGLGNALYREGETRLENPQDTLVQWHNAVDHYEATLAMNPHHEDARFNLDLVKKRIQALEKQQQQNQEQQQQGQNQNQEQQQQNQKQESQNQNQPQNQDGQSGQDQEEQSQQDPSDGQDQPQENEPQDQDGENDGESEDEKETPQGQLSADDKRPQQPRPQEEEQPDPETGFTPSQARQLLRSLADEDLNVRPLVPPSRDPVFKDW